MLSPGQFSRAPILEAILSIRLEKMTPDVLPSFQTLIESWSAFSTIGVLIENQVEFQSSSPLKDIELKKQGTEVQGFAGVTSDGRSQVQLRTDGFSFHRLAPYGDWNSFRDAARPLWEAYRLLASSPLEGTELRYLNKLEIPFQDGRVDFGQYLNIRTEVPDALPYNVVSDYFLRVQIPQPDLGAMSILQQGIVQPELNEGDVPKTLNVILDNQLVSLAPLAEPEIWPFFERLRQRKNEIFAAALTPKMQEVIS